MARMPVGVDRILLEEERHRRLGPQDESAPFAHRLVGQPQVSLEDRGGVRGVPFDRLVDVALDQADATG
jgi:hypothetical protein